MHFNAIDSEVRTAEKHFETMFWKLELVRTFGKRRRVTVHSTAIWNDVLEVGTAKKILKTRSLNVAFLRNLKRCFGSWNCWDFFFNRSLNGAFWLNSKRNAAPIYHYRMFGPRRHIQGTFSCRILYYTLNLAYHK